MVVVGDAVESAQAELRSKSTNSSMMSTARSNMAGPAQSHRINGSV